MDNETKTSEKLKYALTKFLEPGFYIKNEVYLNSLLTHLIHKGPEGLEEKLVEKEYLKSWIIDALSLWEVTEKLPNCNVMSFAVQNLALLSKQEQHCFDLSNMSFFEKVINVLKLRDKNKPPIVKLAFIKLLSSLLEHDSGVDFLIITGYWSDVFEMCLRRQTIYLTKDGIGLIKEFLGKASLTHGDFCTNVIQQMVKPLQENRLNNRTETGVMEINERDIYSELLPTLQLIINVMEYAYEKQLNFEPEAKLASLILKNVELEKAVCNLMMVAKTPDFFCDLIKIKILLRLQQLLASSKDGVCASEDLDGFYTTIKDLGFEFISDNRFYIPRIILLIITYWEQLCKSSYKLEDVYWDKTKVVLEDQIAFMQLIPFCCSVDKYSSQCRNPDNWDEFTNHFVDMIVKRANPHTLAVTYKWRDQFDCTNQTYEANFHKELPYIMKSRTKYSRDNVALFFNCFFYYIKGAVLSQDDSAILARYTFNQSFIADLLHGIDTLIREFNIKWTDTFESICVLSTVYDFLNLHTWNTKVVEAGLKLITTSIEKYMTPNMTLLIDRINDSAINQLGPFLYAKLHDPEWQVRDSALETILVIADASKCKFQSFRSILSEVQIPQLVVEISLKDGESFVRATALKCLSKMCLVDEYWDNYLSTLDIPDFFNFNELSYFGGIPIDTLTQFISLIE